MKAALADLPATVEGMVVFELSEGDQDFGEYSNWNFGTITIDGEDFEVDADGEVLRHLKIPDEGGMVRATISSVKYDGDEPTYKITSIEAL